MRGRGGIRLTTVVSSSVGGLEFSILAANLSQEQERTDGLLIAPLNKWLNGNETSDQIFDAVLEAESRQWVGKN